MSEVKLLPVPEGLIGQRADAGLSKLLGLSRSNCAELITSGLVSQNGKVVQKSDRLLAGAFLEVSLPKPKNHLQIVANQVEGFSIVFQDEDIVVVDKPAGVAAHPSVGWDGPTVPGALLSLGIQISTSGAQERQGIVQRLDVGTSGLMVLAKSELAYSRLKQAFRDRVVDKTYHAVIQGIADPMAGTFDAPIGRHPKADYKFAVLPDGKPSVTHYETLEVFGVASLVEIELETGRKNQIRVHMQGIGHPVAGDKKYGAGVSPIGRLGLHARLLAFYHPISTDVVSFETQVPRNFLNIFH